jgi:hypothetical protein
MAQKRTGAKTDGRAKLPRRSRGVRGRPVVHREAWTKVSVVLFERQIVHLDRLATDVRRTGGKVMNRTEIIRALIDGFISSGLDITQLGSEATLRAHVARRLGRDA